MFDIVVVGGCVTDLISSVKRFPNPGETLMGHKFMKNYGGNGANQCIMAQRLGASTALVTKLGNDTFGKEYLQNIKDNQVNTDYISETDECFTSTASILVEEGGQSIIVYVPGSNMKLSVEDVKKAESVIADAKLVVVTYEMPLDSLLEALKISRKHNVLTVVNPAPPAPATYEELYPMTDILCLNEEEAEAATGMVVRDIASAHKALLVLLEKVCNIVILTMGDKGVIFQKKSQETYTHVPAKHVVAVDCLGAGDCFLGSLLYYLSKCPSLPLEVMIQRSCEIAAISVTKHGTQPSYPYKNDLPQLLLSET